MMMKKTIEFKDVINFIDKAIAENMEISTTRYSDWEDISVFSKDDHITIGNARNGENIITVATKPYVIIRIKVSDEEMTEFKIKWLEASKYVKAKFVNKFFTFFNAPKDTKEITTETLDEIDANNAE